MVPAVKNGDQLHQVLPMQSTIEESWRFNEEQPRFLTLGPGENSTLEVVPNDIGKRKRKGNIPTERTQNTFKRLRLEGTDRKSVNQRQITRKRASLSAKCTPLPPTISITASASLSSASGATTDSLLVGLGSDSNTGVDKPKANHILSSIPQEPYHASVIHNTSAIIQIEPIQPRTGTTDYSVRITDSSISAPVYPQETDQNKCNVLMLPYTQPIVPSANDFLSGDNSAVESPLSAKNHHHYPDYGSGPSYNDFVGNTPKPSLNNSYDLPLNATIAGTIQSGHCDHEEFELVQFIKCGCIVLVKTSQTMSVADLGGMVPHGEQTYGIALHRHFYPPESKAAGPQSSPSSHGNDSTPDVFQATISAHMAMSAPDRVSVPPLTIPISSRPSSESGGSSSAMSILTSVDSSNYTSTPSGPNGNHAFEWPSPQSSVPTADMSFGFQRSFYTDDQLYLT